MFFFQDVVLKKPISSPWVGKNHDEANKMTTPDAVHSKEAVKAITEDDVEISTPPEKEPHPDSYRSPVSVNIYSEENIHPLSTSRGSITRQDQIVLPVLEEEESEQPKTLSSNATMKDQSPTTQMQRLSPVVMRKFSRFASTGARSFSRSKHTSMALEPRTPEGIVEFRRAISVQSGEDRHTLFGGNALDVERILNRMAVAIKKDLDL